MRGARYAICAAVLAASLAMPAAGQDIDDGVCHLNVTITFINGGRLRSAAAALGSPSYTMTVAPAIDLDSTRSGSQACAYNLGGLTPFRATTVTATPELAGDLWTCEAVQGLGEWTQSWSPSPPGIMAFKDYLITGTWGAWTMYIRNASATVSDFYAVIELTHRNPPTVTQDCSTGVSTLALTGVEIFQDP